MNRFTERQRYSSDVYITDYTQYRSVRLMAGATNDELIKEGIPEGVDITNSPSTILDSFHIVNKHHVSITAINLERNMQFSQLM